MCGLSGVVVTKPELISMDIVKAIFTLLMEENDSRGGHSWGAWGSGITPVRKLGKFENGYKELHDHLKDFVFQADKPTFLFGHTRFGTHGSHTLLNAHPFEVGNLTLAHNGVVDVDGLGSKDHDVDSGRIAIAITQDGWTEAMAKTSGSCALLVSVSDVPMIYRHGQVLSHAVFPWGTVVCSTKAALELVVVKRLGMTPDILGDVEEDAFCQPGFGQIHHPAPAKERYFRASTEEETEYHQWWDHRYGYQYPGGVGWSGTRPQAQTTGTKPVQTLGWSGESDLKKIGSKVESRRTPHVIKTVDPIQALDDNDPSNFVDNCEYCGNEATLDELSVVQAQWAVGPMLMCLDCIMDEVCDSHRVNVLGGYETMLEAQLVDRDSYSGEGYDL